jgi:Protein of unknown function (DUF2634)
MSIFPFLDNVDEFASNEELPIAREWAWDFESNDFKLNNGKPFIVEGLEAVKIWTFKALRTDRFKHTVYSWEYGSEINSLIGSGFTSAAIESEVKRMIDEALMHIPYIVRIDNLIVTSDGDSLNISFSLDTVYGNTEVSV